MASSFPVHLTNTLTGGLVHQQMPDYSMGLHVGDIFLFFGVVSLFLAIIKLIRSFSTSSV